MLRLALLLPLAAPAPPARLPKLRLDKGIGRFLVLTQPRSGSTWFAKYSKGLAGQPGVVTAGEALHPDAVRAFRARSLRTPDPVWTSKGSFTFRHMHAF